MTGEPLHSVPAASPVTLRFAPSPTGRLHLGHALSALLNQDMARRLGGCLLIRIEDIDRTRCRAEFAEAILDDLAWLGIRSDGPILRQSEHAADYRAAAARLANLGLLYPCFATRQEIQAAAAPGKVDPDGAPVYPGLHRWLSDKEVVERKARGEPFAQRLDMARAIEVAAAMTGGIGLTYRELDDDLVPRPVRADPARWGDVVIERKEAAGSYHLAVVVDDARQGVTHVVRGADLRAATDVHRLLQVLLGLPEPVYRHHRLILDAAGRKLAKRDGAESLASLRRQGMTADDIRRLVGLPSA
jgi:glutamyl-Q tRNA(Asp) synthetase